MADKGDKGLIGFDPLAWMNEKTEQANDPNDTVEIDVEVTVKGELATEVELGTVVQTELEIQETTETNSESKLTLEPTLNIQNVGQLYEQLLKQLETKDKIEIDASAVVLIDTATLQLLVVLKRNAVKLHKEVIIDFPSDKFIDSAELLGLSEMLEVDNAAAGFF